jgi:hypothetical protein
MMQEDDMSSTKSTVYKSGVKKKTPKSTIKQSVEPRHEIRMELLLILTEAKNGILKLHDINKSNIAEPFNAGFSHFINILEKYIRISRLYEESTNRGGRPINPQHQIATNVLMEYLTGVTQTSKSKGIRLPSAAKLCELTNLKIQENNAKDGTNIHPLRERTASDYLKEFRISLEQQIKKSISQ